MGLHKLGKALAEEVNELVASGTAKGREDIITGVIKPEGDKGPRYFLKGKADPWGVCARGTEVMLPGLLADPACLPRIHVRGQWVGDPADRLAVKECPIEYFGLLMRVRPYGLPHDLRAIRRYERVRRRSLG